jgi:hypothetical protein
MNISITQPQRVTWSLLDISEATGLSLNFLRGEVRRGNLKVKRFGRRVLVRDEDFRTYIDSGSSGNITGRE